MKTAVIIQARMSSTRLPGKVLKPVLGKPLLTHLLERLKRAKEVNEVVVATSTEASDDALADFCAKAETRCIRGPLQNVLERYSLAAEATQADILVRITGDCPLLDPAIVDRAIAEFKAQKVDYISNAGTRTYARGMDVEVFSSQALMKARELATEAAHLEHVTPFIYQSGQFNVSNFEDTTDHSQYRLTVDTPEDLELVTQVFERLYPSKPNFDYQDILRLLEENPDLAKLNEHIEQKKL